MGDLVKNEKVSALAADADGGLSKKKPTWSPPLPVPWGGLSHKKLGILPLACSLGGTRSPTRLV